MKKNKAFTVAELIIGLIISVIILLAIGAISQVGPGSYGKLKSQSQVYNDILYGFELIKNKARLANTITIEPKGGNWQSDKLVLEDTAGNRTAFGLYQPRKSTNKDFIYLKNNNDENAREIILENPDPIKNVINLTFAPDLTGKCITVNIDGNKGKEIFNLTATVTKRN